MVGGFHETVEAKVILIGAVRLTGGFGAGITAYSYVGGGLYSAQGVQEKGGVSTERVESAPGKYMFGYDVQQGWTT